MSINKIKQAKNNGLFKRWDILVYSIILLTIVVLFVTIFFAQKGEELKYIEITINDEKVFRYTFIEDNYENLNPNLIVVNQEEKFVNLTIYKNENKDHYNKIKIDKAAKKVYLIEANCSLSKDCTHMIIEKVGDNIICVPHNLIISTNKKEEVVNPTVG